MPYAYPRPLRAQRRYPFALSSLCAALLGALSGPVAAQEPEPPAQALDTVVVTASGFEQDIKQAPASISVVTREELEQGAFRDLTDALRTIEGVSVIGAAAQAGGGGQDISIRGMPGSYTLILVDGKRQNTREARTNGNAGFEQGWIPPLEAIDRIEIIRGPMSSLYGSDAMGGVINIITRKVATRWGGSAKIEGTLQERSEAGNSAGTNFYLSGPIKEDMLGLAIYGGYFRRGEDEIVYGFNKAENYNLNGRLSLTPNRNHDFVLDFGRSRQNVAYHRGVSVTDTTASTRSVNERENVSFTHTGRWGDWGTSTISLYQEQAHRRNFNLETNAVPADPNVLRNTVLDGKWTLPAANHLITMGGQYRKEAFTATNYVGRECIRTDPSDPYFGCFDPGTGNPYPDMPNNGSSWRTVTDSSAKLSTVMKAVFIEDEWSITDKFALTGGIRLDDHEIFGREWTPRAYAVYHFNDNWTLKGGISKGYKAPSARDILPGYALSSGGGNGGGSIVIRSNPDLQPETSINQEIGLHYGDGGRLSGGLTLFNNDFKNKTTEITLPGEVDPNYPGATIRSRVNVGKAVMRGVEGNLKWAITDTVSVRGTYTFIRSKITDDPINGQTGLQLAGTPKQIFSGTVEWKPRHALTGWARVWAYDKQMRLNRTSAVPTISPGYVQVDVGGSYQVNKTVTLHAAIYNLGDKRLDYETANQYIDGRRLWVGMNVKF
ncbi:MAG: TonB-dependent receptor [Pigmentiphaga sp.]|uniref:TonB-dependent receptor domain-containing protein n=1 Tax=Pigmentiphaga sp. TaxID=1977564 RepID=UPI0029A38B8F|nr:TonB-dependent receptor [Pigmentiphaga sp.]MDX3906452.1 TonB-dependent receptor [Pigmentiphaga sp.]